MELAGKTVLVVGLGKSGMAAARLARGLGAAVTVCDEKPLAETQFAAEAAELGLQFVNQQQAIGSAYDLVVQSPGVPLELPLFAGARVVGDLEFAAPYLRGRIIGITGSNGKTTTTALIGHILREAGLFVQVGGNIGTAPAAMAGSSQDGGWTVLELSSFQLETVSRFRAHIAVVLNITPDHLDRHKTMDRYIDAKARLLETQTSADVAILNHRNPAAADLQYRTHGRVVFFGIDGATPGHVAEERGSIWIDQQELMQVKEIPLVGHHNVENVMAAGAAAWLCGIPHPVIAAAVRAFPGVEHRIEFVRELNGVRYYNDSKATNVDATEKALDSFPGGLWLILGGKDKKSDYRTLASRLRKKARRILLVGMAAPIIRQQLMEADPSLPLEDCVTIETAIRVAREGAKTGETVLLAPACASFDQFQSYEHRGQVFKSLVHHLQ